MNSKKITIHDKQFQLPHIYIIPKMHKIIPKERYIAASNKCTTKPISQIITKCLKLVTSQHRKLCNAIYKYTGVNRMWIIDNTSDILDTIDQYNDDSNTDVARNIRTYDFLLYIQIFPMRISSKN
jgi:hypothetical protein